MFCVFLNGCIIPWPHVKQTCGPICGNVMIGKPNNPIEGAHIEVRYPDGGTRTTETNEYGFFHFPEKKRFHWGVLFGVALNHSLPIDDYIHTFSAVTIEANDYEKLIIYPDFFREQEKQYDQNILYLNLEDAGCPPVYLDRKTEVMKQVQE